MSNDQNQSSNDTGQFVGCMLLLIAATLFLLPAIIVIFVTNGCDLEEAWTTAIRNPLAFIGSFVFWLVILFSWVAAKDKQR